MKQLFRGLMVLGLFLGTIVPARSGFVYWSDFGGGDLRRPNLDGSGPQTLMTGLPAPADIKLDLASTTTGKSSVSVVFSPDGHRLVSAGSDGSLRVWDGSIWRGEETGQESFTLRAHPTGADAVAFSPDGRWLASGGEALGCGHQEGAIRAPLGSGCGYMG